MRFWIGKELEGRYKGIITLFVEADVISESVFEKIKDIARRYTFGQIYFGAGEIDVVDIADSVKKQLCMLKDYYMLTVETHKQRDFYKNYFNHIVFSFTVRQEQEMEYTFKIRTDKNVYCLPKENCFTTNLSKLKDGLFVGTDIKIE